MFEVLKNGTRRLLRRSERYTGTDMVYLAGNGFWLTVGQLAIGLIAFGLSVAFANLVDKDVYGTYRFLLSVFWALTAFSLTGLPTILAQAIATGKDWAYDKSFGISLLFGMPMALIALAMAGYYYVNGNELLASGMLVIGFVGPFIQTGYLYGSFLEGKRAFKQNALFGIIVNTVPALALLTAMFFFSHPLVFLSCYLAGYAVTGLLLSFATYLQFRPKQETGDVKQFVSLSGHFSLMNVLNALAQHLDRILVFHYLGAVQLAVYAFATTLPDQVKTFASSIGTLAFPKFAARDPQSIHETFWRRLGLFTLLMAVVVGAYYLLAPYVFTFFFPEYMESLSYSLIYALALIPLGAIFPITVLEAHLRKKELYAYNIATALFQIGAITVGVAFFGIIGAIVARIVTRTVNFAAAALLAEIFFRRATPVQ